MYLKNLKDIDIIIEDLVYNYKSPLIYKNVDNKSIIYSGYKGEIHRIRLEVERAYGTDDFVVNVKIAIYERYFTWVEKKSYRYWITRIGLGILKSKLMPLNKEDFYR